MSFPGADQHDQFQPTPENYGFQVVSDGDVPGAMSDGSNRRDDTPLTLQPRKKSSQAPFAGYGGCAPATPWVAPSSCAAKTSSPEMTNTSPGPKSKGGVDLPVGVPDFETWGRTMIEFGNYEKSKISYAELFNDPSERARSYVKWCKSRAYTVTASGQLRDLGQYLLCASQLTMTGPATEQGPIIPGTSRTRSYK